MPPIITNLAPKTELEAVNLMLAAIGEAPVEALDSAAADIEMALNLLGENTREVQSWGWRFNTEFELAIAPEVALLSWTDPNGTVLSLRVFLPPATNVATWKVSDRNDQVGLDVVARPSKVYAPTGTMVLYDRARNRDGFPSTERSLLYLDVVSMFGFEQLPETMRTYLTVRAARQLQEKSLGSEELGRLTEKDEFVALRAVKRDPQCSPQDEYNVIDSVDVARIHLGRRPGIVGVTTPRRRWR
jgi:hypothetical protein